jgi:hypothetical protein
MLVFTAFHDTESTVSLLLASLLTMTNQLEYLQNNERSEPWLKRPSARGNDQLFEQR